MRVVNDEYGVAATGRRFDTGEASVPGFGQAANVGDVGDRVATDACLLWCLRRLVLIARRGKARCPMVHVMLQRQFGDAGLGIEHLLRCLMLGLAMHSSRRLAFGLPGCPLRTDDEIALLALITDRNPAACGTAPALMGVAGEAAGVLQPLVEALRSWLKLKAED